jgi:hypothetical protein
MTRAAYVATHATSVVVQTNFNTQVLLIVVPTEIIGPFISVSVCLIKNHKFFPSKKIYKEYSNLNRTHSCAFFMYMF